MTLAGKLIFSICVLKWVTRRVIIYYTHLLIHYTRAHARLQNSSISRRRITKNSSFIKSCTVYAATPGFCLFSFIFLFFFWWLSKKSYSTVWLDWYLTREWWNVYYTTIYNDIMYAEKLYRSNTHKRIYMLYYICFFLSKCTSNIIGSQWIPIIFITQRILFQ